MTPSTIDTALSISLLSICLFCAGVLFGRWREASAYIPLSLLFMCQGVGIALYLLTSILIDGPFDPRLAQLAIALSSALDLALPFLCWLYVRGLTSEDALWPVPRLGLHLAPIAAGLILLIGLAFLPPSDVLSELAEDDPRTTRVALIALGLLLWDALFKIVILSYLIAIIRRLHAYRERLRDVFSSTEDRELRWIWTIAICGVFFWIMSLALSASIWANIIEDVPFDDRTSVLSSGASLALFWVLGTWGLRQKNGWSAAPEAPEPDLARAPGQKYEKSALDAERAARIAAKIEAAMVNDLLYRDPNLSLWDLAKHVGVTSHYVSQTLNTYIGSSFFDYVNARRIQDAVTQLSTTDETILMIAYDVGFNSRSAFYKAFRRETGKTPSDMRK